MTMTATVDMMEVAGLVVVMAALIVMGMAAGTGLDRGLVDTVEADLVEVTLST